MGGTFSSLHVVMLGLDSAGKTTVLYRLKFHEFVNTVPTIGFNAERVRLAGPGAPSRGFSCHLWDVGGQEKLRPLWRPYSRRADGLVYVVDSVDAERLEEARAELHRVARSPENQGTPMLVIANKQDLPRALDAEEIRARLQLEQLEASTPLHLQPACAITGEGLEEGMGRLQQLILKRRRRRRRQ
ncbi:ADP-ribosylation factor-like 4Ca [Oryzias melastigma]|uniref:ADP-ribosylation factor-like protein 4C n=1 Tax=Oryzias melastigma TaxID=30732 RepID=UPI000CF83224|nr:ADP-ribosylation factor-like protein 4C [Oryzias melastigma]XP_036071932.1 ADP-ribosylation factor-like 4Ca [Oryzias melastigma]